MPWQIALAGQSDAVSEIVVTSQRRPQPRLTHAGNIEQLDAELLQQVQYQHIHELLNRAAGVWVVRGSGQDHQTAMRSPVLGGAGSCGGFLVLEDGIPVRPSNFCNNNQLIEVNAEQARSVEVVRGPGNALYGSNALHGIINVLMPMPGDKNIANAGLEVGSNNFFRVRASVPFATDGRWFASVIYADDGGFRDESGYRQGKVHLKRSWLSDGQSFTLAASVTELQQETAGFIVGENAYKDTELSSSNPNPEAFRDANSFRLYGIWHRSFWGAEFDVRPYLRRSDMQFLHHGLPGQPVESNGQVSAGVITAATFTGTRFDTVVGLDVEWSDVFLEQTQPGPASGSARQRETRPEGKHYDYGVVSLITAPFVQSEFHVSERLSLTAGVRVEYAHYDYRNHMLAGNTRDDGSVCGFGGCLYSRPADRTDTFVNVAPKLSASFQVDAQTNIFFSLARGFRAPQTLELYRLQNGQQIADLDTEEIDGIELGLRNSHQIFSVDLVAFLMRKRNSTFRDAEGFNISGARSLHRGVEAGIDWQLAPKWRVSADMSYAIHKYDFDAVNRGETFVSGNDVDTAPRWLGSLEILVQPTENLHLSAQWTSIGSYYLEPANIFRYSGHSLINLRAGFRIREKFSLIFRLNNILDERVADRADYAARNYRYLPGRGREVFAEARYIP